MRSLVLAVLLVLPALPAAARPAGPHAVDAQAKGYACPMPEHPEVFAKPGRCPRPRCGMELVAKGPDARARDVAILVFDGVQVIDYAAPFEVFGQAGFRVFTVGPTTKPVTTAMGQTLVPSHDFASAPPSAVLVLPGGDVPLRDARIVDFVRTRTAASDVVLSVCTGAFWLAKADLLDGLTVTTFHGALEELQHLAPKARVVRDRRFADSGKIVTSAGLTSGLDGAMHVVDRLLGRDRAREVALTLEYDWRPDSTWARASLADRHVPNVSFGDGVRFHATRSLGDADHWHLEGRVETAESPAALAARLSAQLTAAGRWTLVERADDGRSTWSFADDGGRPWRAAVRLSSAPEPGTVSVELTLDRQR
jgi:putative intracellular protease/amidase